MSKRVDRKQKQNTAYHSFDHFLENCFHIDNVYNQIVEFAKELQAEKAVLFGSRARGNNKEKSDIDVAIYGCKQFELLKDRIDEELWSLLQVDLINMNETYISRDLIQEINRDGVLLYEKV